MAAVCAVLTLHATCVLPPPCIIVHVGVFAHERSVPVGSVLHRCGGSCDGPTWNLSRRVVLGLEKHFNLCGFIEAMVGERQSRHWRSLTAEADECLAAVVRCVYMVAVGVMVGASCKPKRGKDGR